MDKSNITIIILGILILTIIAIIFYNIIGKLDERIYIVTTYMYIFGSILFVILCSLLYNKFNIMNDITNGKIIAILILTFVALFGIMLTPRKDQILKYLFFFVFLITIAIPIYLTYKTTEQEGIIYKVLIALAVIVLTLSFIAYTQPLDIFNSWGPYLLTALIGLIVIELLDIIFGTEQGLSWRSRIYGWIIIILFSGFILYDTNNLRQIAKKVVIECKNKSQIECTDYPTQSLSLILDILNMFQGLTLMGR